MHKIIFAHSLFRTGSTYLWHKLRNLPDIYCYYEPLHQDLINLNKQKPQIWDCDADIAQKMHHPVLKEHHHLEYLPILRDNVEGLPGFKKRFSFEDFCRTGHNPSLKKYLENLITAAPEQAAIFFKFNRSAMRTAWFKRNFPQASNLYLVRHPRDQWTSYWAIYDGNNYDAFIIMDLVIAHSNCRRPRFKGLAGRLPLSYNFFESYSDEERFYRIKLGEYSLEDQYRIFYYIWCCSFLENILHADLIININMLDEHQQYRQKTVKFFRKNFKISLNFDDMEIKTYARKRLEETVMDKIEEETQGLVLSVFSAAERLELKKKITTLDPYSRGWLASLTL